MAGSPSKSPPVVLIVENDPLLRVLAVEVVEEAGLVALEAAHQAVFLLESRRDISLFTDIDMPGSMDGLKLACAVRDRWSPIKSSLYRRRCRYILRASVEQAALSENYQIAAMVGGIAFAGRFPSRVRSEYSRFLKPAHASYFAQT
jgi:CheY-like chemotaxis protein